MPLEQRDKELAAIGASIGANCRPCIEHHVSAGRDAGLAQPELEDAVATAHRVRAQAADLLEARVAMLLGHRGTGTEPVPVALAETSASRELVALGVSVGANAHGLLQLHVGAAVEAGLQAHQIRSALKMAGYVQRYAASITADEVARVLAQHSDASALTAATP